MKVVRMRIRFDMLIIKIKQSNNNRRSDQPISWSQSPL